MTKRKGPLSDFAGETISKADCDCGTKVKIKVNRAGYPYYFCPKNGGCGVEHITRSHISAKNLVARSTVFVVGVRGDVLEALDAKPEPKKSAPKQPEYQFEDEIEDEIEEDEIVQEIHSMVEKPPKRKPKATTEKKPKKRKRMPLFVGE